MGSSPNKQQAYDLMLTALRHVQGEFERIGAGAECIKPEVKREVDRAIERGIARAFSE